MPRTKEQFEEMRIKSKRNILNTALILFSTKGYHATSINAIAKEAGVAVGLMYNYFSSKEELLSNIIDEFFEKLTSSLLRKTLNNNGQIDIPNLIDEIISELSANHESWKLLISIMFQPDVSEKCKDKIQKFFIHQKGLFETYYKQKGIDRPDESAKVLTAILHGLFLNYAILDNLEELMFLRGTIIAKLLEKGY